PHGQCPTERWNWTNRANDAFTRVDSWFRRSERVGNRPVAIVPAPTEIAVLLRVDERHDLQPVNCVRMLQEFLSQVKFCVVLVQRFRRCWSWRWWGCGN